MQTVTLVSANQLSAGFSSSAFTPGVGVPSDVMFAAEVSNGSNAAPTTSPQGTFVVEQQVGGVWLELVELYGALASISPAGNTLVRKCVPIRGLFPLPTRLTYRFTSGGGPGAVCNVSALYFP